MKSSIAYIKRNTDDDQKAPPATTNHLNEQVSHAEFRADFRVLAQAMTTLSTSWLFIG